MQFRKHAAFLRGVRDPLKRVILTDPSRNYVHPALEFLHVRPTAWTVNNNTALQQTATGLMLREYVNGRWWYRYENSFTQHLLYTNDFENAAWIKTSVDVVAGDTVAGPFGTPVKAFAGQAGSNLKRLRQNKTTTTTGDWSMVWVIKPGTETNADFVLQDQGASNGARFRCNLQTGAISSQGQVGTTVINMAKAFVLADGFVMVSLGANFSTALTQLQAIVTWDLNGASTSTGTLYVAGCNLTNTKFPTPFSISTDQVGVFNGFEHKCLLSALGLNLNNGFTAGVEGWVHGTTGQVQNFLQIDNDTNTERFQLRPVIAATGFYTEAKLSGATTSGSVLSAATVAKKATTRLSLNPVICRQGVIGINPTPSDLASIATWTHLRLGSSKLTDRMFGYMGTSWISTNLADNNLLTAASL